VNELIKPAEDTLTLVHDWLYEYGIEPLRLSYSAAKDWIKVSLPVSEVERLLDTEYSVYKHEDGSHVVRTPSWSLPKHLHEHITAIQPTNSFFRASPRSTKFMPLTDEHGKLHAWDYHNTPGHYNHSQYQNPNVSQVCNTSLVTPLCLRTLYGTVNYVPRATGKNKVGLTDYLGEANNRSDVRLFLQKYRPEAAGEADTFQVVVINNGDNQQTPNTPAQVAAGKDLEGNLDAETIIGIDYPTPLIAYTTGGSPPFVPDVNTPTDTNEPYLDWVNYVLGQSDADIPQIISTSYGDDEQTVPYSYAQTVCSQFAQLGARGVSLLFASGDNGVGRNGTCVTNDGKNTSTFLPSFPDGCPYVTSVGATHLFNPEVVAFDAANGFVSGGGYSNYFARPAYQDAAVNAYTASLGNQFAGLYNKSGRAYPDIAAQGERFATIWDGRSKCNTLSFLSLSPQTPQHRIHTDTHPAAVVPLDGTSASTPAASAVLALVNDALLAAGRPPLGFLNPWLYQRGYRGFTDITSGSAIGCNTSGFPAEVGWDAVTGFGTPVSSFNFGLASVTCCCSPFFRGHSIGGWGASLVIGLCLLMGTYAYVNMCCAEFPQVGGPRVWRAWSGRRGLTTSESGLGCSGDGAG